MVCTHPKVPLQYRERLGPDLGLGRPIPRRAESCYWTFFVVTSMMEEKRPNLLLSGYWLPS
jgi:hypothetical protein